MAKLFFRYGAMNSGKSTAALQVAYNYEERGMKVLLIKPSIDTKGEDTIVSRLGAGRKVDICAEPSMNIALAVRQWNKDVEKINCIITDEAQFFTAKQIEGLLELVVKDKIPVICYGIRTDFQTKLFPGSARLMELAHSIEELKTICRCGKKATFNGRKQNGEFVFEGDQVAIDGEATTEYESLCPECYLKKRGSFA